MSERKTVETIAAIDHDEQGRLVLEFALEDGSQVVLQLHRQLAKHLYRQIDDWFDTDDSTTESLWLVTGKGA